MEIPFIFVSDNNRYHQENDAFIVDIKSGITGKDNLFKILSSLLLFPSYFGFNWDALFDCLRDFSWINQKNIILVHESLPELGDKDIKTYLELLRDTCIDWRNDNLHHIKVVFNENDREKIISIMNQ